MKKNSRKNAPPKLPFEEHLRYAPCLNMGICINQFALRDMKAEDIGYAVPDAFSGIYGLRHFLCALLSRCGICSAGQLSYLLGLSLPSLSNNTRAMCTKGLLACHKLKAGDFTVRNVYTLGESALGYLGLSADEVALSPGRRLKNILSHEYALSYSYVAFLQHSILSGRPFSYKREAILQRQSFPGGDRYVRSDAVIDCSPLGKYYIEADMRTEPIHTLQEKLENYYAGGHMTARQQAESQAIVFGVYTPCPMQDFFLRHRMGITSSRFLPSGMPARFLSAQEAGYEDFPSLFEAVCREDGEAAACIRDILAQNGCLALRDAPSKELAGPHGGIFRLIEDDLKAAESLYENHGCGLLMRSYYGFQHLKAATDRRNALLRPLLSRLMARHFPDRVLRGILGGCRVYVVPIVLLANYIPFLTSSPCAPLLSGLHERIKRIYPFFDPSHASLSPSLPAAFPASCRMPFRLQQYLESAALSVSVEYLSADLGAFLRGTAFFLFYKGKKPLHLILIADCLEDIDAFINALEDCQKTAGGLNGSAAVSYSGKPLGSREGALEFFGASRILFLLSGKSSYDIQKFITLGPDRDWLFL